MTGSLGYVKNIYVVCLLLKIVEMNEEPPGYHDMWRFSEYKYRGFLTIK